MNKRLSRHRRTTTRAAILAALLGAAIAASFAGAPPDRPLPEVALGWSVLLHIERAAAVLLVAGATFLILWRASQGRFPIRFGNLLEFEATEKHTIESR